MPTDPSPTALGHTDAGSPAPPLPIADVGPAWPRRRPRAALAAFLSFLWPGLGQAYRGERVLAIALAVPPLAAGVALVLVAFSLGPAVFVTHLLNPVVSLGLLGAVVALGLVRVLAIGHAGRLSGRTSRLVPVLVTLVVITHGWLGYNAWAFYRAGEQIYEPIVGADPEPTDRSPGDPTPSAVTSPDGSPVPPSASTPPPTAPMPLPGVERRVTILIVGIDNTHGPDRGLTDTLIVASFDPATDALAMLSLPRDTARLPFYGGGIWRPRINTLMQTARRNPELFPDGPMGTLVNEMEYIVGVPIDYYAQIDIAGFTRLIDMVGGIDVVVERTIDDRNYQFTPDDIGFHLEPGNHRLDGKLATAYVRSRHGPGNSDYERARRQQRALIALRNKLNDPAILGNLPGLLDAVSAMVRTDAPLDRLPEIVAIAQQTGDAGTRHVVLAPPRYAQSVRSDTGERTFMNELRMDALAALSIELFGAASRYASERVGP